MERQPVPRPSFDGLRVLVVEDDAMVRMLVEDMLDELGCTVAGSAARLDAGLALARGADFDAAVLDLNLSGEASWPIAHALLERELPFVLSTGYEAPALPAGLTEVMTLGKPFGAPDLARALAAALGRRPKSGSHGSAGAGASPPCSSSSSP